MITSVSDSSRRGVPIEAWTSAIRSATATASSQCGHAPPGPKRFINTPQSSATLLTEIPRVALWALVDDGRLGQTCGHAELDLVRRALAQAKAALSTRVVAIGLAALNRETATASTA